MLMAGCVIKRGVDFGHWAASAEVVPLVRVFNTDLDAAPKENATVLVLPTISEVPEPAKSAFYATFVNEFRYYFPYHLLEIDPDGQLSEYVQAENLMPTAGIFDFQEVARLGSLLGTPYVLCSRVRDARLHPPQVLAVYMALIESGSGQIIIEVDGTFDASEQQTVIAIDDYLQRRKARVYDRTSLDILLRSPKDFAAFACSECCRAMADNIFEK